MLTNWRVLLTVAGLVFGLAIIAVASEPIRAAVAALALPGLALALAAVVVATVITLLVYAFGGYEVVATRRATRSVIEAEAETKRAAAELTRAQAIRQLNEVTTAAPGSLVYHVNYGADLSKALHLQTETHLNGHISIEPNEAAAGRWFGYNALHAPARRGIEAAPAIPGLMPGLPSVVDLMGRLDRILLVGGTGSGKTNLLKHYVAWLISSGYNLAVIDPHSPSKLLGLDVIGAGLNWSQIADYFVETMAIVSARYQNGEIAQNGNLGEFNRFLIIEEFWDIQDNLGELAHDFLKCLLVRARKAGFKYTLVTQNDSADALGMHGNTGLLRGADHVEIKRDLQTSDRRAFVGWRKADLVECSVPGLYPEFPTIPPGQMVIDRPASYSDTERALIRAMVDNPGASKADIYRAAGVSKNGPNSRFIDEFQAKMGVQA